MSSWRKPDDERIETYTVVTTTQNELAAKVHNRIAGDSGRRELRAMARLAQSSAGELLRPYPADEMKAYPVSTRINTPKNDDVWLLEHVEVTHPAPCTPADVDEDWVQRREIWKESALASLMADRWWPS